VKRHRVVIVDDSPTMRAIIRMALTRRADLEVVGEAGDPLEARTYIREMRPDVITLDVEMPNMNGLEFLDRLMRLHPIPVVMVSTLTQAGAEASLSALERGAVDCVGKPTGSDDGSFETLAEVVAQAASARVAARSDAPRPAIDNPYQPGDRMIAIGASTGGVEALMTVLGAFPQHCPPTVVTQHMPANFTTSFAGRLDRHCAPHVGEARDGDILQPGHIYLAPGGMRHLTVNRLGSQLIARLIEGDLVSGHRPSVDALFRSVAIAAASNSVGVILTGMGSDGAAGLLSIRQAGGATIGQDEASSVVFGMPRVADELGAVLRQLPLHRIASAALSASRNQVKGTA
jgi:two-component system, chemotaxis family, protein-glutamate methylesterase/glutaminase